MNRKPAWHPWLLALLLLVAAAPAAADGIVATEVEGDSLSAEIELQGGVELELTVRFEEVVGLSLENLGLAVELLDAADLLALQSRLGSELVSVPAGLPVLVTIEPPAAGGLSFAGMVSIELYTHGLLYVPGCPFRLFSAPLGGTFTDITGSNSGGSYRVRGHSGDFSEFLVVADTRALDTVIIEKFTRLEQKLTDHAALIETALYTDLVALLDQAVADYEAGDTLAAISGVESFAATVKAHGGAEVPDVWRSARDLVNAAGDLRAGASTLRFSLLLKANAVS